MQSLPLFIMTEGTEYCHYGNPDIFLHHIFWQTFGTMFGKGTSTINFPPFVNQKSQSNDIKLAGVCGWNLFVASLKCLHHCKAWA